MNNTTAKLIERDYAKTPLTIEELELIFGAARSDVSIQPFLNSRHAVYKEHDFAQALPARDALISMIIAEPNLLRRPITRRDNHVVIGFDKDALLNLIQ